MKFTITQASGLTSDILFRKMTKTVQKEYPKAIKLGLGEYLNVVREASISEIIPDSMGVPKFQDMVYRRAQYILQETNPARLTSRSGRLVAGLAEGDDVPFQDLNRKISKTDPQVFKSLTGKITGGGTGRKASVEQFSAQWSPYIRSGSIMLTNYKMMGHKMTLAKAKKALAIRFRHEVGIRGTARPFFAPAHQKHQRELDELVMNHIRRMNAKYKLL